MGTYEDFGWDGYQPDFARHHSASTDIFAAYLTYDLACSIIRAGDCPIPNLCDFNVKCVLTILQEFAVT